MLSGAAGDFNITGLYTCPSITAEVYITASGGNPGLSLGTNNQQSVLLSALGPCGNLSSSTHIVINEASTIGSIYPITPFMSSYKNIGSSNADFNTLAADFMQVNEFINTDGGQSPGPALPAGFSAPVTNLYTLANAMASCINSAGGVAGDGTSCGKLLQYATPPGGTAPTNTADAILNIANNPTQDVVQIFSLASATGPFQPTLSSPPPDWSLRILPNITLSTPSVLVGVGSTNTGTITLGQAAPAGGLSITFVSSNTAAVTVVSPVTIPAGSTTGTFSYTGVASGSATLTATASGYVSSSVTLQATNSLISLGTIPTVAPGQSVDLPLSLGTPAPAGGVTVNFTSANTGVATISPASVTIAAGLKVPTANPKVTGVTVGSTVINATATGYAPGAQTVAVSVTASLPATFSVPIGTPANETLTISAPAPAGGITFTLSSDNTGIATVPASVTVAAGATTASIAVTGIASGTTTIRADSPGITEATSSVTVNGSIVLQTTAITTGKQVQVSTYFYFAVAPPNPVTATITSNAPAVAVVSTNPAVQGGATATIAAITNTGGNTFYVQGVSVGSATFTISAPGYMNTTISVTVDPSGFVIYTPGNFSTTTLSADTSITVVPAILNPGTGAVLGYGATTPAAAVNVAVSSSNTAVGTITNSPITFGANASSVNANFHSVGAGTANISLTTPSGFSTPSSSQQITATVTAPPIGTQSATITSGAGLEVSTYAYLSQTPQSATNVTITSSNPAVAVVSTSATTAGAATATVPAVVNTGGLTYYIQGVSVGTSTLTISASPYASATVTVTVDPSGFVIYTPGNFSTTTFSSATSITLIPAILNPGTLSVLGYASVSPLLSSVSVPVTSSNTATGTIGTSPVVFHGGDSSQNTTFQPVAAGTSNITLGTPAGFSTPTPAATQQITATVTAPPIGLQTSTLTTGINLEVSSYVYLSQTPPNPVTVTLTSSAPAVATVSTGASTAGTASTTFPNTVSSGGLTFYVQGQTAGTSVITVSAPGYASSTINVTVDPSGFVIYNPGNFTTTTFSPATTLTVLPAILNPSNLTVLGYGSLNPGISTVNVAVNSSATQVGTVTSPITFSGGSSQGASSFQPVAAGTSTVSLVTPAGYSTPTPAATQAILATVTAPPIGTQTSNITTGVNFEVSTYAYLSTAPPSAVNLTITSNDPTTATVSTNSTTVGTTAITFPSVTSAGGLTYYIQGRKIGSTTLTLSAAGYSNATVNVTVDPSGFVIYNPGNFSTTTFSTATPITLLPAILSPGTLTVLGYATLSAGVGAPQVAVTSSNTAAGTVTSPVTFNAGDSSDSSSFQPVGAGTTNITISTPAGYSTPSASATQQITATVTAPPIGVQTATLTTGANLQVSTYAYLSQAPPSAVTMTLTSSNPAIALLSKGATTAGAASITFPNLANTGGLTYYVEGLAVGSSTLTLSAPGYSSATVIATVDPSGFVIYTPGSFSTSTYSAPTSITLVPAILNPGVLTVAGYASLNPGLSVTVPLTSSATSVGTVSASVTFSGGDSSQNASFQPIGAGSTVLSLVTPAGFTTPSQSSTQQITATVSAPPIGVQTTTLTTGSKLQVSTYAYLSSAPPSAVTLTITSANAAIATVSASATAVGTQSIGYAGVTGTSAMSYYVQGQTAGSTTLTLSAPGYQSTVLTVTVGPSGFVIYTPGDFTTTTTSGPTTITIAPAILNAGVLTVAGYAGLNPGFGTVSVPVGSTSPQIGTVTPTSLAFAASDTSHNTSFQPIASGTTDVVIVSQPAGFTTPSQPATQQIVATVQ